jgi:uncharacterized membrane protein YukC
MLAALGHETEIEMNQILFRWLAIRFIAALVAALIIWTFYKWLSKRLDN